MSGGAAVGLRVGILTVSDGCARGEREDRSGDLIAGWCGERGWPVAFREVVPDETARIVPLLLAWCDSGGADLVLTTGGTGFGPRDVTPEATDAVLERTAPGIPERIRRVGTAKTPHAALSRGRAGSRGACLVVNLPGSPGGVRDGLEVLGEVVEHACELLRGEGGLEHPPAADDGPSGSPETSSGPSGPS